MGLLHLVCLQPAAAEVPTSGLVQTPRSMMADQLMLLAWSVLQSDGQPAARSPGDGSTAAAASGKSQPPRRDQLVRARYLMDQAQLLDPDNAELLRMRAELAGALGDQAAAMDALREYCRLRPTDDAALLKLLTGMILKLQTVEERVAEVERLLGSPAARKLTDAARSRLWSLAAQGAREMGDAERCLRHLKSALELDSTNKHAAAIRYDMVQQAQASLVEKALAMMGLMRADPIDPVPHRTLAEMLLSLACYDHAAQQFTVVDRIAQGRQDLRFYLHWALANAASGQHLRALSMLNEIEKVIVASAEPKIDPTPADLVLPPDAELTRLLIHEALGDQAKADGCFGRVMGAVRAQKDVDRAQNELGQAWLRVWLNREVEQAQRWHQEQVTTGALEANEPSARRLAGWLALRRDERDLARQQLEPLAETDPPALYGLALCEETTDRERSNRLLHQLIHAQPTSVLAVSAAMDLWRRSSAVLPADNADRLLRLIAAWPRMFTDPDPAVVPWTQLVIRAEPLNYRYLEPQTIQVTLFNISREPLSLGEGGTIPHQVLLTADPKFSGTSLDSLQPIVVDMARRLRLEPQESVRVAIRIDHAALGALLTGNPDKTYDYNFQAVLDPRYTADGRLGRGLLGNIAWMDMLQRRGLPVSYENVSQWVAAVNDPDPVEQMRTVARLCWLATRIKSIQSDDLRWSTMPRQIGDAVSRQFMSMDALARTWVIRFITPGDEAANLFATALEFAQRSDEPLMRLVYLATQVSHPDSPALAAALRHKDPVIAGYAKAVAESFNPPPLPTQTTTSR